MTAERTGSREATHSQTLQPRMRRLGDLIDRSDPSATHVGFMLADYLAADLAVRGAEDLRAAGYPALLSAMGGRLIIKVPLPTGRSLALDPMAMTRDVNLRLLLDEPNFDEADVWEASLFDEFGEQIEDPFGDQTW